MAPSRRSSQASRRSLHRHSGTARRAGPGIQTRIPYSHLDSGLAPAARPGMTRIGPRRPMPPGVVCLLPRIPPGLRRMKDILDRLEQRRAQARLGGGQARIEAQHKRGKLDRARAHRAPARQGLVRGVRHVRRAPLHRLRHGEDQNPRRRRRHRLGHGERPHRLSVRQGLHRVRRLAVGDPRAEDHQGAGHGDEGAGADHRPVRRRRRAHPGGRRLARRLRRGVQAQRHRLRRDPADQRHHGPVRGRRRLFAGHDRLHLHGERHELHVRHRPRRGEDRDQRGGHRGGARRRVGAHHQILDRRRRLRERRRVPAADAPADRLPAVEQLERRAGMADARRHRARGAFARHARSPTTRTSPTTSRS